MPQPRRVCGLGCILLLGACQAGSPDDRQQTTRGADSVKGTALGNKAVDSSPGTWRISPGGSGPFTDSSSEAQLRQTYGDTLLESVRIELGEGETAPGSALYPADSTRRLEILWRDTLMRKVPERLILRGSHSRWKVGPAISLGTSLKDLERLNGRPFTLAGFGWDYAGVVTDWKGGGLDSSLAGIKLYLDPGPNQYQSATYSRVLGDRDYSSDLAPMQELNPRVYQIFVDFQ